MRNSILLLSISLFAISCQKEDQSKIDDAIIQQYIQDNNLNAEVTEQGIYYVIEDPGTGRQPGVANIVVVDYKGYLPDGAVFDSSYERGQPATFRLRDVILGWQIGIPLFKERGAGTLLIPSRYAYGAHPPPGIPANAVLIFDIELHEVR